MRVKTLKKAIEEAKRFIEACEVADRMTDRSTYGITNKSEEYYHSPSHHIAAAKRASMDLTRMLADFRRG